MQQKDTIIIAVLINLAILSTLFLLTSEEEEPQEEKPKVALVQMPQKSPMMPSKKTAVASQESIEDVLKNYSLTKKEAPKVVEPEKVVVKEAPKEMRSKEEFYIIKSGDNPWTIAKKFSVGFDEFLKMNNLDEKKARKLNPGDKVRVR
jgi:peptidoglycan DL-endopeptidase LytF